MEKSHEEIIRRTVDHIKANLGNPISVSDLARKMGFSPSYLRFIFRESTGKGLLPLIIEMRIQRVKELLNDTALSISDISFAAGFTSLKQLCTMFRKKVGCSPTEYRRSLGLAAKPKTRVWSEADSRDKPWRYEPMQGPLWNSAFKILHGNWQQGSSFLFGGSQDQADLRFLEPLPENFRITFEVRLVPKPGMLSTEIDIWIQNSNGALNYLIFVLGKMGGSTGELRPRGFGSQLNPKAVLSKEQWHKIDISLRDDSVTLAVDGSEMFAYKDPFPPPYSWRSHLAIGTYQGQFEFREFTVYDAGVLPLIRNVRQGDSLYNAGLFSSARDVYLRLIGSKTATADLMELRYKIGRCFLQEKDYFQAQTWMEKVIKLPETRFWADQAELALLQIEIREETGKDIREKALALSKQDGLCNGVREILDEAASSCMQRGFFERAAFFHGLLVETETPGTYPFTAARVRLADTLMLLRKFDESAAHFRRVIEDASFPISLWPFPCFSLCDNYGIQGKREEWKIMLGKLSAHSASPSVAARLICYWGIYFRAMGEFEKSLAEFAKVAAQPPPESYWLSFAELLIAQIQCCTGKIQEARAAVDRAVRSDGGGPWLRPGQKSWYLVPMEIAEDQYEKAARLLLDDSALNPGTWMGAWQAVKAGILFAIAGKQEEADATWKKASELFIARQVNFFGPFAEELRKGNFDSAFEMPYAAEKRSEVFFMLGLLCETRREPARAQAFFEQCVKEDKLLHWPTHMARNRLSRSPMLSSP